jgi:hypothetical protein
MSGMIMRGCDWVPLRGMDAANVLTFDHPSARNKILRDRQAQRLAVFSFGPFCRLRE